VSSIFANEIEPFAAEWLANLGKETHVDTRSITQVLPADVVGFRRVHFFAGIGGWELALQLAGWPEDEEIWTGSCPCQPFSVAGKRGGTADERHLWPEFFRLVRACRPRWAMGEQVSSKDGLAWLGGVFADLEAEGYTCWAVDTCAAGVGAPHIRQRLYWVAYAAAPKGRNPGIVEQQKGDRVREVSRQGTGKRKLGSNSPTRGLAKPNGPIVQRVASTGEQSLHEQGGGVDRLEHAPSDGREQGRAEPNGRSVASGCGIGGMGQPDSTRRKSGKPASEAARHRDTTLATGPWSDAAIIHCRDGKSRPISPESGDEPLAYGIPLKAGHIVAALGELGIDPKTARRIIANARRNRTGRLRGYGNAIVPQCAVEFIKTILESSFRT